MIDENKNRQFFKTGVARTQSFLLILRLFLNTKSGHSHHPESTHFFANDLL